MQESNRYFPTSHERDNLYELARRKFENDYNVLTSIRTLVENLPYDDVLLFLRVAPSGNHVLWGLFEERSKVLVPKRIKYFSFLDFAKEMIEDAKNRVKEA